MFFQGLNRFFMVLVALFCLNTAFAGGVETRSNPWMIYMGGFGGYYTADFLFQSLVTIPPGFVGGTGFQPLSEDTFQQSGLGGGQIGVQYHMANSIYFLGLVISGNGQGQNANLSFFVFPSTGGVDFIHHLQDTVDWDFSGVLGLDFTTRTHFYTKFGIVRHNVKHQLSTTNVLNTAALLIPRSFSERYHYWNMVLGLGMTYDFNRWLNAFLEYDFYHYKIKNLNTLQNFAIGLLPTTPADTMAQKIRVNALAVRVGLNLKFLDPLPPSGDWKWPASWIIYGGAFVGMANTDFQYRAQYFFTSPPAAIMQFFNNDVFQQGFSGGGQIGVQYHTAYPYFFGVVSSIASDAKKAYLSKLTNTALAATDFDLIFHVKHHGDIAFLAGADVTPRNHLYGKLGAGFARFNESLLEIADVLTGTSFPQSESHTLWGWMLGLGVSYDITRWLNIFAEYDLYSYKRRGLNINQNLIAMNIPNFTAGTGSLLSQNARIIQNTIRAGLNIQWRDSLPDDYPYNIDLTRPWTIILGAFTGYYYADFQYSAFAMRTDAQQFFHNDTVQYGSSGGGQIGIQYHFQTPYFIGLTVLGMANGHKAQLALFDFATTGVVPQISIAHQFRIRSNWDFTLFLGTDLTDIVHTYVKAGISCARITHAANFIFLNTTSSAFQDNQKLNSSGWTFGLGATRDWNRWFNSFIEYDYYGYNDKSLNALNNIIGGINTMTQHVRPTVWALLLGINLTIKL